MRGLPRFGGGANGSWVIPAGIALAAVAGLVAGGGELRLAIAVVAIPAFLLIATALPERTTLGLIVLLPFFIYPASAGGFSLFLAVPTFGFVSIILLMRDRPPLGALRRDLPVIAFAVLLAAATAAALLSADTSRALSRVVYLVLFGLFAFALAATLSSGRLSRESVAKAMLVSGGLAAAALAIQFAAQYVSSMGSVQDWLFDVESLFAGERAAEVQKSNWVVADLDVLRAVFPFMSPATAGQYMMFALIAGVWLRRERTPADAVGSTVEIALIALIAAALLVTFSRQSWIGAAVGIVALGLGRRPLQMLAAALLAMIVVVLVPIPGSSGSFGDYLLTAGDTSTESTDTRLELWEQTLELIPEHALIGAGPGLIGTLGPGVSDRPFYAHNIYLDAAVEVGIVGALALLAVFLAGLTAAYRREAALAFALIAAFAVAGMFDDVLYAPRNGLMLAIAFALIAGGCASARRTGDAGMPTAGNWLPHR